MNHYPSRPKSSIVQRGRGRCFGWMPVAAVLVGTAACATSVRNAAPDSDGRQRCAIGTYDITAIEANSLFGLERASGSITGTGGSMRFSIKADGTWRLFDNGSENMRLAGGPITAQLSAQGAVEGRYESDGAGMDLHPHTLRPASHSFACRSSARPVSRCPTSAPRSMPDGRASITCDGDAATMTSAPSAGPTVTVTLRPLPGQEGGS